MRLCARLLKANTGQEVLVSQGTCGVKRRPLLVCSHGGSHWATHRHFLFRVYLSVSSPADSAHFGDPLVQRAITALFPVLTQVSAGRNFKDHLVLSLHLQMKRQVQEEKYPGPRLHTSSEAQSWTGPRAPDSQAKFLSSALPCFKGYSLLFIQQMFRTHQVPGDWRLHLGTHSGNLLVAVVVVVGKWRGRSKETDEQIDSVITKKVHPREGPILNDVRCDFSLLNSPTDSMKTAFVFHSSFAQC